MVDYDGVIRMLRGGAAQIRTHHALLSQLDSAGGDGDHGTTMVRAMDCMERALTGPRAREIKGLVQDVGWAILGVDGGATGPLLGSLFMGMLESAPDDGFPDARSLAASFASGLAAVRRQTKAQVGDKTLIDALVPAVEALRTAADGGASVADALRAAADAAERGAVSTKGLEARFGRAKNIKEQSIGSQDPGATSMALMFKGFSEGIGEAT